MDLDTQELIKSLSDSQKKEYEFGVKLKELCDEYISKQVSKPAIVGIMTYTIHHYIGD